MYRDTVRSLNRNMHLFLRAAAFICIAQGIDAILFSLFLLSKNTGTAAITQIEAMRFWAGLFLSVPCGLLSDRLGRKRAMRIGLVGIVLAMYLRATLNNPLALMAVTFFLGAANSLTFISISPFIAEQVEKERHATVYAFMSAFYTGIGVLGFFLGGLLPDIMVRFGIPLVQGQKTSMLFACLLMALALLPTSFIKTTSAKEAHAHTETSPADAQNLPHLDIHQGSTGLAALSATARRRLVSLALPEVLAGTGSGMFMPLYAVFLSVRHAMSSSSIGILQSVGEVAIFAGVFITPLLAKRFGLSNTIGSMVFLSAPFLLLLANSPYVPLVIVAFLMRDALMNATNPLKATLWAQSFPAKHRGFCNGCLEMSFSLSRAALASLSGVISESIGFSALFSWASLFYALAGGLFIILNRTAEEQNRQALTE